MTFTQCRKELVKLADGRFCTVQFSQMLNGAGEVYHNAITLHLGGHCVIERSYQTALAKIRNLIMADEADADDGPPMIRTQEEVPMKK